MLGRDAAVLGRDAAVLGRDGAVPGNGGSGPGCGGAVPRRDGARCGRHGTIPRRDASAPARAQEGEAKGRTGVSTGSSYPSLCRLDNEFHKTWQSKKPRAVSPPASSSRVRRGIASRTGLRQSPRHDPRLHAQRISLVLFSLNYKDLIPRSLELFRGFRQE